MKLLCASGHATTVQRGFDQLHGRWVYVGVLACNEDAHQDELFQLQVGNGGDVGDAYVAV